MRDPAQQTLSSIEIHAPEGAQPPLTGKTERDPMNRTLAIITAALTTSAANAGIAVDTELSLVIDASGSIGQTDFDLQLLGYANAFRDASIQSLILDTSNGRLGSIAVNAITFSTNATEAIGFTLLDSAASINAFADQIETIAYTLGWTNTGAGMTLAHNTMLANNFDGTRRVVDVSTDGNPFLPGSQGGQAAALAQTIAARNLLLTQVDQINAIGVGNGYNPAIINSHIIGGTDAFLIEATDFNGFGIAIREKLEREIIPSPSSATLLAIGGLAATRRRRH